MTKYRGQTYAALAAMLLLTTPESPALSQDQSSAVAPSESTAPESTETPAADQAYVPPKADEPPLPTLPATPVLDTTNYPDCREDFQKIAAPFDKAEDTNRCTLLLDQYYAGVLTPFRQEMIDHQNALSALYSDKVGGQMKYSQASRDKFYKDMMQEHADSDPDGSNLTDYRASEARYQDDRAYLQDRFCFNTGCGGYPAPTFVAAEEQEESEVATGSGKKKSAKKSSGPQKCKKARKRGGFLGGVLGGVVGDAAGLGTIGTIISSGVGAVLVGEIACKLTDKEQKVAAEATVEVTEKEEVGATAEWKSPTRSGVSGSSTVTALNTEPSGRRCMNITDVAIIDGEETRVAKQMCRGPGESRYTVMA